MAENYFKELYGIDMSASVKEKNGLSYAPWAKVWGRLKSIHPDATYDVYTQPFETITTIDGKEVHTKVDRPWFDDGRTGWVRTGVTVNGIEHIEELPILNFSNKAIDAEKITSADANKSIQRSITKACARHGIALHVYENEEFSEDRRELIKLQESCFELAKKRSSLSNATNEKVKELCNTILEEEQGNPKKCEDIERLKQLEIKLRELRKIVDK